MAKQFKLTLIVICLIFSQASFGQKKEVQNAYSALGRGELQDALTSINNATNDEDTKVMAKTWLYRGKIMDAIAASTKDQGLVTDPAGEAVKSYIRAYQLDEKREFKDDIYIALYNLFTTYYNQAVASIGKLEYGSSYKNFARASEIMKVLPKLNTRFKISPDTATFYKGYSAYKIEKYPAAKSTFQYLIDSTNYRTPDLYVLQGNTFLALNDTAGGLAVLEKGKAQFPDNLSIMLSTLNIYLFTNRFKEAIDKLNEAIDKLPNSKLPEDELKTKSSDLYNALGDAYDRVNDTAKGNAAYRKAIEVKPDYFRPYFSLGAEYYNVAVEINKNMNKLGTSDADQKKYDAMKVDRDRNFIMAIPFLEKAHSINAKDMDTLRALKEIYTRTNQKDKADKIKAEIDALGGK